MAVREIVLDTETTGLDPASGHRIVEIGCVELVDRLPSGNTFQRYINPEREMSEEALAVHGLSEAFLRDQPLFAEVAADFLDFITDSPLVIHNADFDLGFVNMELQRVGFAALHGNRAIDTVLLARRKFPGAPASLDALCKRFAIDNSVRELHGALLDASLLAEVYLELTGGRQTGLKFGGGPAETERHAVATAERPRREPRPHVASPEEQAAHAALLAKIKNPIWGT